MDEAYINLINAIILQAFKDYRWSAMRLRRDPTDFEAQKLIHDIETFCRSEWLTMLTEVDGEYLLGKIKEYT